MLLLSVCPSLSLSDNFLHSLIYVYIYIYIYTVELNWWTKHVTSNPEILCSFLSSDHLLLGAVFGVLAVPGYTMGQCRGAECKTLGREGGRRGGAWRRATAGRGDWFGRRTQMAAPELCIILFSAPSLTFSSSTSFSSPSNRSLPLQSLWVL